jgi:hypothetical protein
MTFEPANNLYPQSNPSEENASREGQTTLGEFGTQTTYLFPDVSVTPVDISIDGLIRDDFDEMQVCSDDSP